MHPILARRGRLGPYLGAWTSVVVLLAGLVRLAARVSWPEAAAVVVLPGVIYGFMCLAAFYPCKSAPLRAGQLGKALTSHVLAALLTGLVWLFVIDTWLVLLEPIRWLARVQDRTNEFIPVMLVAGVVVYLLVAALHYLLIAMEESQKTETHLLEARAKAAEAELKALQAQLDPHFLFNALTSVSALVGSDPVAARQMCQVVAAFLRDILRLRGERSIPLREELELVDRYLTIEQTRFGARLRVEREIEAGLGDVRVPPLLLQPLVENAIKHGISQIVEGGAVSLTAHRDGGLLRLEVHNPYDPEGMRRHGEGVGLASVRARLAAVHGPAAGVEVEAGGGRFAVRVAVPLEPNGELDPALPRS
ncbi:MAG TPA: histidine kinase [Thermoanaerobaculaceae bacterium]|nr:histidine kinase [Thermoanaerobaculaceae bacterium]HPS77953.1 histidine kinase [Thermoanaerobaculaceae bacterium]